MLKAAVWRRLASVLVVSVLVNSLFAPSGVVLAAETVNLVETESSVVESLDIEPEETVQKSEDLNIVDTIEANDATSEVSQYENEEQIHSITSTESIDNSKNSFSTAEPVPTARDSSVVVGPETTPLFAVSTFEVSSGLEFVELYNQGDIPISIADISFRVSNADGETCSSSIVNRGWVLSKDYLYVVSPLNPGSQLTFTQDCELAKDITRLELFYRGSRIQLIDGIIQKPGHLQVSKGTWTSAGARRQPPTVIKQDGSFDKYYWTMSVDPSSLYSTSPYISPNDSSLKIVEILPRPQSTCMPSSVELECGDYIKIVNTSNKEVNLAEFRIRVGSKTSSVSLTTSYNWHDGTLNPTRDELMLKGGSFFVLRYRNDGQQLNLANGSSAVWIEDYAGLQVYDEVMYKDMDKSAATDKSWAYDVETQEWKLGLPNPMAAENIFISLSEPGKGGGELSGLKPCKEDQFRHPETNRCRKIASVDEITDCGEGRERNPATGRCRNVSAARALTPCKEGQYRSEETNRCRSIASAASTLKPCAEDQFRNPETNRCKKIASADELKDCGEGRERNPETNRCRNVLGATTGPDAPFAPEQVNQTAQGMFGWWVIGGASLLALGYAGWQWRFEVKKAIEKFGSVFAAKSK